MCGPALTLPTYRIRRRRTIEYGGRSTARGQSPGRSEGGPGARFLSKGEATAYARADLLAPPLRRGERLAPRLLDEIHDPGNGFDPGPRALLVGLRRRSGDGDTAVEVPVEADWDAADDEEHTGRKVEIRA